MRLARSTPTSSSCAPSAPVGGRVSVGSDISSATNGSSVSSVAGKKRSPAKPCAVASALGRMNASAARGAALKKERIMKVLLIITDGMTTGAADGGPVKKAKINVMIRRWAVRARSKQRAKRPIAPWAAPRMPARTGVAPGWAGRPAKVAPSCRACPANCRPCNRYDGCRRRGLDCSEDDDIHSAPRQDRARGGPHVPAPSPLIERRDEVESQVDPDERLD